MRRPLYHVVCRDCPTESLRHTEDGAAHVADGHAASTDHDVVFGRVERPTQRATLGRVE